MDEFVYAFRVGDELAVLNERDLTPSCNSSRAWCSTTSGERRASLVDPVHLVLGGLRPRPDHHLVHVHVRRR